MILVVDDKADLRELTARVLTDAGHHIIEADSFEAALVLVQRRRTEISLAVLDVDLGPGFDGIDLACVLQRESLRTILRSELPPDELRARARTKGLDEIQMILDPNDGPERLVMAVRILLQDAPTVRALPES